MGERDRLQQLVSAGIALSSELSLEALLRLVTETAAAVTGARYAALGVLDSSGTGLEQFVTVGLDDDERQRIGALPRGRGILGVLIADARPLRLRALGEDPRSVGFPPGHPPMSGFLGVPLSLRGVAYGNLYLTDKAGGEEFTGEDEELVLLLAAQAAVAIENARLYENATRWLAERESLDRIANELVREPDLRRLLGLIAESLRELIQAGIVTVWLSATGQTFRLEAISGDSEQLIPGFTETSSAKLRGVLTRERAERIDSMIGDPEIDQQLARRLGLTNGLWAPLVVNHRPLGVVAAYNKLAGDRRFTDHDLRVAVALAARAAVAVELRQRLSRSAVRAMLDAQERERQRIARELHDETGQALTSILLALKPLEADLAPDLVAPIADLVRSTLADVRKLAVELRPAILDDFGLRPALERLAQADDMVELRTNLREDERLPNDLETAIYRIAQEALTNIHRHADANHVVLRLDRHHERLRLTIHDDGRGFRTDQLPTGHYGLTGIRERAELLGGTHTLESAPGKGTTLIVELPLPRPESEANPEVVDPGERCVGSTGRSAITASHKPGPDDTEGSGPDPG